MTKPASPHPRVVLLDLGGVLVELSGVGEFAQMAGAKDADEVWHTWLHSPAVRAYESGQIDTQTFARRIVEELHLKVTPEHFAARFETWPGTLFEGAHDLVADLRKRLPVGCLSNTNDLHWQGPMHTFGLHDAFDHYFLSYRMGKLKPDAEAFQHVVESLAVEPHEVLFLDDNQINVDGARAIGMDAHVVKGPDQARALLRGRGLL